MNEFYLDFIEINRGHSLFLLERFMDYEYFFL